MILTDVNGAELEINRGDIWITPPDNWTSESSYFVLSKREAINLASKLLQWGTSS